MKLCTYVSELVFVFVWVFVGSAGMREWYQYVLRLCLCELVGVLWWWS